MLKFLLKKIRKQQFLLNLSKDFLSYGVVGVLSKFIGFFVVPIYTRFLTPEDFGILATISTIVAFILLIGSFQLETSFFKFFYDTDDFNYRKNLFSVGLYSLIPVSILLALILLVFANPISVTFLKEKEYSTLFIIAVLQIPFKNIFLYTALLFRVEFNRRGYAVFNITYVLFVSLLGIYAVAFLGLGVYGILISQLIATILFSIFLIVYFRKYLSSTYSLSILKKMLSFGLPILPASILSYIQKYLIYFFIMSIFTMTIMGYYSIANKIAIPILLAVSSIKLAWVPFALSKYKVKNSQTDFKKFLNVFVISLSFIVIFLTIFSKEILLLFATEQFIQAFNLVGYILCTNIIVGTGQIMSVGLLIREKTKFLSLASMLGVITGSFFMYFLSIRFGILGLIIGSMIGEIFRLIAIFILVNRYFPSYFCLKLPFISIISTFIIISIINYINHHYTINFTYNIILFLLFLIITSIILIFYQKRLKFKIRLLQ